MRFWPNVRPASPLITSWALLQAGIALVSACGDSSTAPIPPTPRSVATIEVDAAVDSLAAIGASIQFTAVAKDAQGTVLPSVAIAWSSTATSVATVSPSGLATAVGNGNTTIQAQSGGKTGTMSLRVTQTVAQVVVTVSKGVLTAIGDTAQGVVALQDAGGHPVAGATAVWQSSDPSIATVSVSGIVTAVANGVSHIVATSNLITDSVVVTVGQLAGSLVVTPDNDTLVAVGNTAQLAAVVNDANGHPLPGPTVDWDSDSPAIASVDASGLVTAVTPGVARVVAASGALADTATIYVTPLATSLAVSPRTDTLTALGDTVHLTAAATDANGHLIPGQSITWTSVTPAVANVTPSGVVSAVASGMARIVATSGALADTATIYVTPIPTSLVVSPQADTLTALGDSVQLVAVATDANGYPVAGLAIAWIAADTAVVNVTNSGLVTAKGNGQTIIVAGAAGLLDTTVIRVAQSPASVTLAPALDTLTAVGDTVRIAATAKDRNGHPVPGLTFTWNSTATAVATVNQSGLVTAVADGPTTITASVGSVQGSAAIVVEIPGIIVFSTNKDGNWELYSVLSDGTQLTRLTQTANQEQDAVVSADGSRVAYTRDGDAIYVMDIDGSNQLGVVTAGISARQPSWSPDGSQLAFSWRATGSIFYDPYRVTVETGQLQPLTFGTYGLSPLTWSHGDSIIAGAENQGIAVFGINHDSVHIVAAGLYGSPRFSPDGQWIAFQGRETNPGSVNLYRMHSDGTVLTQITTLSNYSSPTWSPDGTKLAYAFNNELWVMNADGTNKRQVTFSSAPVIHPSWYN